ncbi:alkaline phosphatase family protein [uncultured Sphingomonas sp.]|uniref:alkaline phosphatase family protein n=1 Tax=uncultured Sphingomonas sp. TaxID=158754 RepID=UPI0025E7A966|nr:alkaline phosphatase family protein [uncultured Sphingomonas sp.]
MNVLLLELNEINFEQVLRYAERGKLRTMADLVARHGLCRTTSEQRYEELEPWIQWVTAHTGLTLAEHGIYRLGDVNRRSIDQIWEVLERQGIKVGAISPMNANNQCIDPAFFMPDPWTTTKISGERLAKLYPPVAAAVNNNADTKLTRGMAVKLLAGLVGNAHPQSYAGYTADVVGAARGRSWRKAMVLDRLLADVFISEVKKTRPGFASLFLNAGAHIQHHYLFNSATYDGPLRNPDWYVSSDADPVLDVYRLYDKIVGRVREAFPDYRIMLATGLHQNPHGELTLYWRLRNHGDFLSRSGVPYTRVEPRMSRDFVIFCDSVDQAKVAESRLDSLTGPGGKPLFAIDNRGDSLFVELIWSADIGADFVYLRDGEPVHGLREDVAFVAIKNGEHNGTGYFIDTGRTADHAEQFALTELPARIAEACNVTWRSSSDETAIQSPA